ncbi:MGMT family protein [Eisenibacter elegans]|uniref:MGMT family protein n=1 Tax=Eisenibacter elegans TaxID=997 RepID=UPI000406D5E6|nr:MGMT family protein [Eisenibacter elegans]
MDKNSPSNFFEDVYAVVRLIPKGKVTSYGAIANYLGSKGSARMVGWAMNQAHTLPDVPAHRVVNRKGVLTGKHHFETPTRMEECLKAEGITVVDDAIVDFEKHFWDPAQGLAL